jgi:Cu/Ag efflux pump CusA
MDFSDGNSPHDMEENFKDILERDEKIEKVYKPNKRKFWTSFILLSMVCWIWVFSALTGSIPDEGKAFNPDLFWLLFIIASSVLVGGMLITALFGAIYYKNTFYAYTDKRILIRSGVMGTDYKSLEFKALTATIVNVTFLDKILGRNTGNIRFGSPSSPIGSIYSYAFKHIVKPYDTLREIKEFINATEN